MAAITALVALFVLPYLVTPSVHTSEQAPQLVRAELLERTDAGIVVRHNEGPREGELQTLRSQLYAAQSAPIGTTVLVTIDDRQDQSVVFDVWRLPFLALCVILFILVAYSVTGKRGLRGLVGLAFSIFIVAGFVIPGIVAGYNALLLCVIAAALIATVSVYAAHGLTKRTTLSVVVIIGLLVLASLAAVLATMLAHLTGIVDEAAFNVGLSVPGIDLRGILIGGMIIATLGVLDDIVTSQVAAVEQIHLADKKLSLRDLYVRASSVGHEHIIALINTLALAYVGVSLPLLVALSIAGGYPTLMTFLNSELVAQEVVRTLVSSTVLLLAVPIATALAAYYYSGRLNERMRR